MEKVDSYLIKKDKWLKELTLLRELLNDSELEENLKWSIPTYTIAGKNVIGMAGFKNYVGLWFFQGVFLKDKKKLLINAQENKTKGLRQLRFKSIEEIDVNILQEYINEAVQNQKEGKEIKVERTKVVQIPTEMVAHFKTISGLQSAFNKLSLSKQKEYSEYISTAKQEKTKLFRIEKITGMIFEGVGLHDKYKKC